MDDLADGIKTKSLTTALESITEQVLKYKALDSSVILMIHSLFTNF